MDPIELDERVEAASTAKTFGELGQLIRDLPDELLAKVLHQNAAKIYGL